jgi:vacuolar-type H+-ATPase subunit E/Vma4
VYPNCRGIETTSSREAARANTKRKVKAARANTKRKIQAARTNTKRKIQAARTNTKRKVKAARAETRWKVKAATASTRRKVTESQEENLTNGRKYKRLVTLTATNYRDDILYFSYDPLLLLEKNTNAGESYACAKAL